MKDQAVGDDDVGISPEPCVKCGGEVRYRRCSEIGCDDGWIDMHEYDDPIMFDDGDVEMCGECRGTGWITW